MLVKDVDLKKFIAYIHFVPTKSVISFEEEFLSSTQKNKSAVFEIITERGQNPKKLDDFKKKLMKCEFRPK